MYVWAWMDAHVCVSEVLEHPADVLQSGGLVSTGSCVNVKPRFTGGRGVRRLKEGPVFGGHLLTLTHTNQSANKVI